MGLRSATRGSFRFIPHKISDLRLVLQKGKKAKENKERQIAHVSAMTVKIRDHMRKIVLSRSRPPSFTVALGMCAPKHQLLVMILSGL